MEHEQARHEEPTIPRYRERKWFSLGGPVRLDERANEHRQRELLSSEGERIRSDSEKIRTCACCRRALTEKTDVGGACINCERVLCRKTCSKIQCAICKGLVCDNPDCSTVMRGKVVCRKEGFFRLLYFQFVGHR